MLLALSQWLSQDYRIFGVFNYITLRAVLASMTALGISLLAGPVVIRKLTAYKIGQAVRDDGPKSHLTKAGTPTMGGALILIAIAVTTLLWGDLSNKYVWVVLLVTLGFGAVPMEAHLTTSVWGSLGDFGELIALAGGVPEGRSLRTVLLGGAAGVFVGPDALAMPLTFEGTRAAGATLGSGVVMAFDDSIDLLDIVLRIAAFFRDESCGQCVPCRVGTVRQEELLARLSARAPLGSVDAELALLDDLGAVMRDASICGLGQAANAAVASALRLPGVLPGAAR